MMYSRLTMLGGIALLLISAPCIAQHKETIQTLKQFIDRNARYPAVDEVRQFRQALIALDEQQARQELARDPESVALWQEVVNAYPDTPTAAKLQTKLARRAHALRARAADDALASIDRDMEPAALLKALNAFLEEYEDAPAEEEAKRWKSEVENRIVKEKWDGLRTQLMLDANEILQAKQVVLEKRAAAEYEYATRLIYDSYRVRHLETLIGKYPSTKAAEKAKLFLARQGREQRQHAEETRRVREFWDARYPSRTGLGIHLGPRHRH